MTITQDGFDLLRKNFGKLSQSQVNGINFLISVLAEDQTITFAQMAYILATAWHETAKTMQPVIEYGSEKYLKSKQYYPYIGYGYVQLTWLANYKRMGDYLKIDLVKNPKLALQADIAARVMIVGMKKGMFTGKRLTDYINQDKKDYINARRIINGMDKAELVAGYAEIFEQALQVSETMAMFN
ncbi:MULTISPECIES: chitinase [Acinetobacter]|uniref:chitinase n=2 Tax=Moraxellaceae TaxID=468 RepID=UPI0005C68A41|nr:MULTISPECIES: chitinase [Acinetobacter]